MDAYTTHPYGLRCKAGVPSEPTLCDWHSTHHYCAICEGWYGVPHDEIHNGPDAHPTANSRWDGCACALCMKPVPPLR